MSRFAHFVLALLLAPAIAGADSPADTTAAAVELPALNKYDHGYKIKTIYDKFEDKTTTSLDKLWEDEDGFTNVSKYSLTPRFWYEGSGTPPSLDKIHFELFLKASVEVGKEGTNGQLDQLYKFKDEEDRKLVFLVDGKTRISAGSGEHDAGLSKRNAGSELLGMDRKIEEKVVYSMPISDWVTIVNGALVEARFGKKAFKIDKPKTFAALKDFTSRMRPEAPAAPQ